MLSKLVFSTLLAAMAVAQSAGVLTGVIVTSSGEPLRNTRIVLVSADGETRRETTTDELGIYAFSLLPAGEYQLEAPGRNLAPHRAGPIVLRAGEKRSWRLLWGEAQR